MKRSLALATIIVAGWSAAARAAPLADSHTLFLNNCLPNGCMVHRGATTDATTDTAAYLDSNGNVSAFSQGATVWGSVLACVQTVMSPFNLTVTDQRPASGPYFEVIVAGTATNVGQPSDLGALGASLCTDVGQCAPYISKAVAFAFANSPFYANKPNAICAAAAQAIALSWALDHVVDASDVMTSNAYTGIPAFHDGEACGSDCVGGQSPFGLACTGDGSTATHTCYGSGTATQNEVQTLLALFGPAPAPPDGGVDGAVDGSVEGGQSDGGGAGAGGSAGASAGGASGADSSDGGPDAGSAGASGSDGGPDAASAGSSDGRPDAGSADAKAPASTGGGGCRFGGGSGGAAAPALAFLIALTALRRPTRRR